MEWFLVCRILGIAKNVGMDKILRFGRSIPANRGEIVVGIAVTFSFVVD